MKLNRTALRYVCVAAAMIGAARGQTQIDLRTQGKNIDFSSAVHTRPSKTGTLVPAVCTIGETFVKTDAAAGKNVYICTAVNVWTVQGIEVPDATGKANQVLSNDGSGYNWQAFGGDITGRPGAVTVSGLGGRKLGSLTPLDGQFLKWNGSTQQWEPTTLAAAMSVFGRTGAITAQTGDYTFAQISGSVGNSQLPAAGGDLNGTLTGATVVKTSGTDSVIDGAGDRPGDGMGWIEVDAADAGGRRCDESLRAHGSGHGSKRGLFVYADFRHCGKCATADCSGRPERCAEHADGGRYTKPASGSDGSVSGTGIGVERERSGRRSPWQASA